MNIHEISRFFDSKKITSKDCVRIDFKKRDPLYGFFIDAGDYEELKTKNLWRIVLKANETIWQKTQSVDVAKIFNGTEITKLSVS